MKQFEAGALRRTAPQREGTDCARCAWVSSRNANSANHCAGHRDTVSFAQHIEHSKV